MRLEGFEMSFSQTNQNDLDAMRLIESISGSLHTISWLWGGWVADIHAGRILRKHDDLDYLTLNLDKSRLGYMNVFSQDGWQTKELLNGDLKLKKDGVKIQLGNVQLGEMAKWTHNGEDGCLLFPVSWLSFDTVEFLGIELHVVVPELQYVLKECPALLNPDWIPREKDILEKEYLRALLLEKGIDVPSPHEVVISM